MCPRCEQGDVVKARVIDVDTCLFVCQECEASWLLYDNIGVKAFVDVEAHMESLGLKPLWSELQIIPE